MRVSAVVPCFNGEPFLTEALESVRNQTQPVDELIVVDDGSTDRCVEIAESFGASDVRQENRGEGAARNRGTAVATGDVIAWLDADDRWLPHHVAVLTGLLHRHGEAVAAFGVVQRFGSPDELIRGYVPPGSRELSCSRHSVTGSTPRSERSCGGPRCSTSVVWTKPSGTPSISTSGCGWLDDTSSSPRTR
jgi:glycosyltransferase involved in cell wall biosynthesis